MKQGVMQAVLIGCVAVMASVVSAQTLDEQLLSIQTQWAQIQYESPDKDAKAKGFESLAGEAQAFVEAWPNRAEPLIWQGIVLSTWAGAKGGLGALSLVKQAKGSLEAAIVVDGSALDGSAYTSLGSLYYQVPGWPIGFGDDELAEKNLKQALALNPTGIDANYFYGDFLLDQDRYAEAKQAFEAALTAPARPLRPLADKGRRAEITAKLAEVNAKLK